PFEGTAVGAASGAAVVVAAGAAAPAAGPADVVGPPWRAEMASISWPLRMRAVPLIPSEEASSCSSASTIPFRPPPRRRGAERFGAGAVSVSAAGEPWVVGWFGVAAASSAGRASTTSVVVSLTDAFLYGACMALSLYRAE